MDRRTPPSWWHTHIDLWLATGLATLGTLAWLPYALSTGFLYDDYAFVSHATFHIQAQDSYRPGNRVVAAVLTEAFGSHASLQYVALALLSALVAASFFAALRVLSVPRGPALLAAALYLVYPRADSMRLWWTTTFLDVAVGLACAATCLVALWVQGRRFGRMALPVGLLVLAAAVLTYEAVAVIVLLPVALAPFAARRTRTIAATTLETVVASGAAVYMYRTTDPNQITQGRPLSDWPRRFVELSRDGWQVMVTNQVAKITLATSLCGVAAGVLTAVLVARSRTTPRGLSVPARARPTPVRTSVAACSLAIAGFLAWLPFAPANDYYTPSVPSVGNRVNGVAQLFFLAALVLALFAALQSSRDDRLWRMTAVVGTTAMAVILGVTFALESASDARDFVNAARLRQSILATVKGVLPAPPNGAVIVLSGYDRTYSPEIIPVFAAIWDFNGAVKLLYGDGSLQGLPLDPAARCVDSGLVNFSSESAPIPYAALHVVDVETSVAFTVSNRTDCRRILPTLRAPV